LIRREICLRRHNDLLPFCLLSNLAFSMVATAMMPSPFISYQKLYRSGFPGPSGFLGFWGSKNLRTVGEALYRKTRISAGILCLLLGSVCAPVDERLRGESRRARSRTRIGLMSGRGHNHLGENEWWPTSHRPNRYASTSLVPWSWRTVVHQGAGEKRFSVASPFLRAPAHQARSGRSPITGIFVDGTSSPSHR